MSVTLDELSRRLREGADGKELKSALRRELRKPLPSLRVAVRANARGMLPRRGGLGAYVAKSRIGMQIRHRKSRGAVVSVSAGRNAASGARTETDRIDAGQLRHPTFGRAPWHPQTVPAGFFARAVDAAPWPQIIDEAAAEAMRSTFRGG